MKKSLLLPLIFLSLNSTAEESLSQVIDKIRIEHYVSTGHLDAHTDIRDILELPDVLGKKFNEMTNDISKNIESYKDFKGLIKFTNKYGFDFLGTNECKRLMKVYLSKDVYKKLNWGVTSFPETYKIAQKTYQDGKVSEVRSLIDAIENGEGNLEKELRKAPWDLLWLSDNVKSFPQYELGDIEIKDLNEVRSILFDKEGKILEKYKGVNGLINYIETLKLITPDLAMEYDIQRKLISVELALSEVSLRELGWPMKFSSLSHNEVETTKNERKKAQRSLRGIQVISVNRSIGKAKR